MNRQQQQVQLHRNNSRGMINSFSLSKGGGYRSQYFIKHNASIGTDLGSQKQLVVTSSLSNNVTADNTPMVEDPSMSLPGPDNYQILNQLLAQHQKDGRYGHHISDLESRVKSMQNKLKSKKQASDKFLARVGAISKESDVFNQAINITVQSSGKEGAVNSFMKDANKETMMMLDGRITKVQFNLNKPISVIEDSIPEQKQTSKKPVTIVNYINKHVIVEKPSNPSC